jgi:capsular polysaccharide transport system permease protein
MNGSRASGRSPRKPISAHLEALDRARMNADRQQVYIAGFVQPSLPEEPLYPRRLRNAGTALFLCCAVWLIGAFIVQTVREHL